MTHRKLMLLAAVFVAVALASCNWNKAREIIEGKAQANANAGVDAIATTPAEKALATGIKTNIATAADRPIEKLPEPTKTGEELREGLESDPDATVGAYNEEAQKDAEEHAKVGSLWAWVIGGVSAVLGVLRFVPGAHQPIVSLVRTVLESRADKAARAKEEGLANAARVMIQVVETGGLEEVKDRLARKFPPAAKAAVDSYLAEMPG